MIVVCIVVFVVCFVAAVAGPILGAWKEAAAEIAEERPAKIAAIRAELLTAEAQRIVDLENEVKRLRGES